MCVCVFAELYPCVARTSNSMGLDLNFFWEVGVGSVYFSVCHVYVCLCVGGWVYACVRAHSNSLS